MRFHHILPCLALLTACGSGSDKSDDTADAAPVGPGACYLDTEIEGAAICYTFSGLAWSSTSASKFCDTTAVPGANIEWREDENCPGGSDGLCEVTGIPGFDFEMYFYEHCA